MPNRIIRDGINSSPRINALSPGAEILYRRLMSVADDYGRFYAAPATIRGACWPTSPGKVKEAEISRWLVELQDGDRPLLRIYTVENCEFFEMANFGQRIQSKSKFPNPLPLSTVENCDSPKNIGASRSRSSESETKSKAYNAPHGALLFDQFWQEYPRKIGKEYALKCWKKISNGKGPQIIEAIKKQVAAKTHWRHPDGIDYIPNPSTWLNQGRWDDEITEKESPHAKGRPTYVPKQ